MWRRSVRTVAAQAPPYYFAAMLGAAKMVLQHLDGIVAHWNEKITNAFMEGLNSVFSAVKRKARGYRSSVYLIAVLYLTSAKLKIRSTENSEEPLDAESGTGQSSFSSEIT